VNGAHFGYSFIDADNSAIPDTPSELLLNFKSCTTYGRTTAEAVSRWLPIAAARIRTRVWQVGFVVDKVTSGQVSSEYFSFPCQNHSFHQLLHHHHHHTYVREK
jgi:hypothetical protein